MFHVQGTTCHGDVCPPLPVLGPLDDCMQVQTCESVGKLVFQTTEPCSIPR